MFWRSCTARALSLYLPPGASARRRAHGLTRQAAKQPLPVRGSTMRCNRLFAVAVSLHYNTHKRLTVRHAARQDASAKTTRLASRQGGLCYLSASGDDYQGAALGRLAPPRAVLPGALYVAQRAEFESRIVDSRKLFDSRTIVDSRLIVVRHSR